jgi:protocadherin Fat 1/2/3
MFVSHRIKCVPFQVAKLTKFHSIEFRCGDLSYPGPCGSHPCMNGAKCIENDSSYTCSCRDASSGSRSSASRSSGSRFSGSHCETDTDPCASNPCLYGAECSRNLDSSDYICSCPSGLSGKRCHYGRHCNPNPCENGGICEEGDDGPICKCRGFTGEWMQKVGDYFRDNIK